MSLFNNSNNQQNTSYNMVGRPSTNTTYADDVSDNRVEYKPTSYAVDTVAQDERTQLLDIQNRLGTFGTTVVDDVANDSADIMPSSSTMDLRFDRQYAVADKTTTAVAMSTKIKVMIATYIMLTLVLVMAVAISAVAVGSNFATIASTEVQYTETLTELAVIEAAIASVGYEQMLENAEALGYSAVDSSNSYSYEILQTRPAQNYNISSNWFDSLCDWVSGAFGG